MSVSLLLGIPGKIKKLSDKTQNISDAIVRLQGAIPHPRKLPIDNPVIQYGGYENQGNKNFPNGLTYCRDAGTGTVKPDYVNTPFSHRVASTHRLKKNNQNSSTVTPYEVANVTGPGAFDGVWFYGMINGGQSINFSVTVTVDGVNALKNPVSINRTIPSGESTGVFALGIVGGGGFDYFPERTEITLAPLSEPIPFKTSCVVTLTHNSSTGSATTAYNDRSFAIVLANIWQTA